MLYVFAWTFDKLTNIVNINTMKTMKVFPLNVLPYTVAMLS